MRRFLLFISFCFMLLMHLAATEVVEDFSTDNIWKLPTSSQGNGTGTFTSTTGYTYNASWANGCYWLSSNCLMLGKANSYIEFPAFEGTVTKVEVLNSSSCSTKVSVKITDNTGTDIVAAQTFSTTSTTYTYEIPAEKQVEGQVLRLAVTNSNNVQISKITITVENTGGGGTDLAFDKSSVELTYGDTFTAPTLKNADDLTINWNSSNTDVATVADGNVEILGIGSTTISATDASDDTNSASYELIVNAKPHGLAYETTSYVVNAGEAFSAPTLTNPNGLTVTYASSNTDVATVDANTGELTLTGNFGTTIITATAEEQNFFAAGTASYTITVNKQYIFADTYAVLVSDVNDLNVGDVIIIANQDASVAMSTENRDNNFGQTAITLSEDKSTISSIGNEVLLMELEKNGDYWLFKTLNRLGTNGYLTTNESTSSTKNYLKTTLILTDNDYPLATIEINSGVAKIIFNKGNNDNRNWLRYNSTKNTGQLFSCYKSDQSDVYIYKLVKPEFKADITIAVDETEGDANKITFSNLQESHGLAFDFTGYNVYLNGTEIGGTDVDLSYLPFVPTGNFTISNGTNTYPVAVTWPITDFSTIEAKVTKAEYFAYCDEEHTVTGLEDSMWYLDAEYTIAPDCEVSNLYCEVNCTLFDPDNALGSTVEKKGNNIVCVNRVGMFMLGEAPTFETNVDGSFNVTLTFPFYVKTALSDMMKAPEGKEKINSFEGLETTIYVTASAGQVPQPDDTEGTGNISGVESVVVDSEGAVEYYNLQGVRVEGELTPGIYIRRSGNTATKISIR